MSTVVVNRNLESDIFGTGNGLGPTMSSPLNHLMALPYTFGELVPPNSPAMKPLRLNTAICMVDQSEFGPIFEQVEVIQMGNDGEVGNNKQSGTTNSTANTDRIVVEVVEIGSDDDEDLMYTPPPPNSPDIKSLAFDPFARADAFDAKRREDFADFVPTNSPIDEYFPDVDDRADYFSRPPKPTATAGWDAQSPVEVRRTAVTGDATTTALAGADGGASIRYALRASNGVNNVNSSMYAINKLLKREVAPADDGNLTRAWSAPSLLTKFAHAMKEGQEWGQEEDQDQDQENNDDGDAAAILEKELYVPPAGADLAGLDSSAMTLALLRSEWRRVVAGGYAPVSCGPSSNIPAEVSATLKRCYTSPPGQWTMGKPDDGGFFAGYYRDSEDSSDDDDDVQTVVAERKDAETEAE